MSLTTSYATEIQIPEPQVEAFKANVKGTPCLDILQLAVNRVCAERNGTQSQSYADCRGNVHTALMAIRTKGLPNGIGLNMTSDGHLVFEYDHQGATNAEAQAIASGINQVYRTISALRSLNKLGYNVATRETTQQGQKLIIITATRS